MREISLGGSDWQFKGYVGSDWLWRDAHKPGTRDLRHWHSGTVPGTVQNDLFRAGEIPNPYFERNTLLIEWVSARTWLYKKAFQAPEEIKGQRVQLFFKGIDYSASFFLNGEPLGQHTGMFTPIVFDISDRLVYGGENLLAVVIEPAPLEEPQVGRTSEVRTNKTRMNYWWDFCPRMVHLGIWDRVNLNVTGPVRIDDCRPPTTLANDFSQATIHLATQLDSASSNTVDIETTIRLGDEIVAQQRTTELLPEGRATVGSDIRLPQPQLWWPNGAGAQPLYEVEVRAQIEGKLSDEKRVRFGVRRVELGQNETSDPTARPYTFVVNGQKVYIKGWNWVPLDVMYGVERPAKLERLLTLARRAHVNLVRVWGGGLVEKDAFFDRCDELGIMVWQEFIQSSSGIENRPSDDPAFVSRMRGDAEQIIPQKRSHPSLVLWCGGNELQAGQEQPLDDSAPVLAALRETVNHLHPGALWLPTSPSGRVFGNTMHNIESDPTGLHDVHGPWEYQGLVEQYTLYNRGTSLFHSEFGAEGLTNLSTLNTVISTDHQLPFSKLNPVWEHLGAWWVNDQMLRQVFGDIREIPALVRASQFLQAEGLRYAVESNERRIWQNSGSIPWQFNEPYPNGTSTCAVDYYAEPKAAYFMIARAYEPVHVSASYPRVAWGGETEFKAEGWVTNTTARELTGSLEARLVTLSGRVVKAQETQLRTEPGRSARVLEVLCPLADLEDLFLLDLVLTDSSGSRVSGNRYLYSRTATLAPMLNAQSTSLEATLVKFRDAWDLEIRNAGEQVALWVRVDAMCALGTTEFAYFEDNYFCLLPGERRVLRVDWQNVYHAARQLAVSGWNTASLLVK